MYIAVSHPTKIEKMEVNAFWYGRYDIEMPRARQPRNKGHEGRNRAFRTAKATTIKAIQNWMETMA